jgi:3',5'-cyclic AMP phosphodiesterase CpdA
MVVGAPGVPAGTARALMSAAETTELTTVADDLAVFHRGEEVIRHSNLEPGTRHTEHGIEFETLPRPDGRLLSVFATVNDVHFGEHECGRIDDLTDGPIMRAMPGEDPYPVTMNAGAVAEMAAIDPRAVIVKGDLTEDGRPEEFAAFDEMYRGTFGDRLFTVRGNHDAYRGQDDYAGDQWIEMPGIAVALLDTAIPRSPTGTIRDHQFDWLDDRLSRSTVPVIVMGHHQQWTEGKRSDTYFGLHPDPSDRLDELCARHPSVVAYTAGHTHRHRVRTMALSGVPSIEIGCVKDFPGTWAEYRVYEGGVMQVVHRISTRAALRWSNKCRNLYADFGVNYQDYALGTLEERCLVLPLR